MNLSIIWIFLEINLLKTNNDFNFHFNMYPLNNTHDNGFIQLNVQINAQYYILFLYTDNNSILSQTNFDELVFFSDKSIFKIFK